MHFDTLLKEIKRSSEHFEEKPWTDVVRFMKEDFDVNTLDNPDTYSKILNETREIVRQNQVLFIYSAFNILCKEEGKLYHFETPYQANIKYFAVMKNDQTFYLLDEDGDLGEIKPSQNLVDFIEDNYYELWES